MILTIMNYSRKSERRESLLYLPVTLAGDNAPLGRIADLSAEGILLISDKKLKVGNPLDVVIALPGGSLSSREEGWESLKAEVIPRWSRPDRNPRLTLWGCSLQIDPSEEPLLDFLIHEYSFSSGTRDFYRLYATGYHKNP